jgi:hypothetical protein
MADQMPETVKRSAASIRAFLRPNASESSPAIPAPTMQPTRADDAAHPVSAAERLKWILRNPIAPEMTAVSYPKRSPPSAAMNVSVTT